MDKKSLNEQEIRSIFIRPAIRNAGWTASQIREEYVITKGRIVARGGTSKRDEGKRADYVLFFKPHIPLAIIEAKDNNHSVSEGMQQAMEYAGLLMIPFVFSSNGDAFSFHNRMITDGEKEQTIALDEFPSPEVLWEMYKNGTGLTTEQETIIKEPYYADREDRTPYYYQRNAINLTVEAVMRGQNRILLVMATGTGKTFTAFQIIWRLWKAGVKKRILFLADRNALIDQTYSNDFSPFKDKMTVVRNRKVDKSYEIFLALYQGLTGEGDKEIFKQFSPSFFDLVIVDECHRGSAKADSAWREVLEYFSNATQIGMTATPKETKDISNIDYFGNPIYTYTLRQGIEDGFLAPYRVIRVVLDKDAEGWRPYEGQKDRYGNVIEDREYGQTDFDRELVLEQRTKVVARVVSNYLKKHNLRFDKTIFFCVDREHAGRMRQALVNENQDMVNQDERYVMRITGDDEIGKKHLDGFRDVGSKYPVLVTTSKLLTTGVDTKMVKFIVLDSNINSMTEFKQIIGRGTQVMEDLGKMFFTIFDFRNDTRHFADPDFDGPCEQDDAFTPDENGDIPDAPDDPVDNSEDVLDERKDVDSKGLWDETPPDRRVKYYVQNVEITVLKQRVQYIDKNGKLITESLTDYTRRNVRDQYATLDDFLSAWSAADRKQAILDELEKQGNFTFAHELGHYFLQHNPTFSQNGQESFYCSIKDMEDTHSLQEREANLFAVELLMPTEQFRPMMSGAPLDYTLINSLARNFAVSKHACGSRILEFTREACIIIHTRGFKITNKGVSSAARGRLMSMPQIPPGTAAYKAIQEKQSQLDFSEADPTKWLVRSNMGVQLYECTRGSWGDDVATTILKW